ncbi:hypothetical protein IFM89_039072 [Coptis chinensis]|uniref:RNase III domain-containing protein n=1 Tax=Coptis chinensis TaxID=261450 RepID=A0A835M376_9MAGN|nr:hypothetical protein IFM89_039072 [Coptis chinensis]
MISEPIPGMKTIFNFIIPDCNFGKVELQYQNMFVGISSSLRLTTMPVVDFSCMLGRDDLSIGTNVSFNPPTRKLTEGKFQVFCASEFVGDAALGIAFANFVYITYPDLDPGQLWLLHASNINTEKLARVAVRHGLFHFVRHNAPSLDAKVNEFSLAIKKEEQACEISAHGGKVKAPKVLTDIVEPVAVTVYVDTKIDLKFLWENYVIVFS